MNLLAIPTPLLIRAIIEYSSSIINILLNILFIIAIIRSRTLRTPQNILLVNSALNLICTCFTFIASVTMALLYSINGHINMELCRILGYLIGSCCHGLMYSYLFSSINCVLNIFNRLKKYRLSMKSIIIGIIFQWFLAFIIASIPLFLNKIDFKIKEHHCSPRRPFFMTLGIVTGFLLPIIFMTTFNLMIYCYINKLQANGRLGLRKESSDRRNEKNFKLLRQFAAFSFVFIFGWGFISFITIFDVNDTVPEVKCIGVDNDDANMMLNELCKQTGYDTTRLV